jgi:hypothetical protein
MIKVFSIALALTISLNSIGQTTNKLTKDAKIPASSLLTSDRKEIIKKLDLSDAQKIKLKTVNLQYKSTRDAVESDATITPAQKKEKFASLRNKNIEDLKAILTADQLKKYYELSGGKQPK